MGDERMRHSSRMEFLFLLSLLLKCMYFRQYSFHLFLFLFFVSSGGFFLLGFLLNRRPFFRSNKHEAQ